MKLKLRLPLITSLFLGLATTNMFAQAAPAAAAAPNHFDKSLLDLFIEGGWVMYPITVCSVLMIWFIVDGFLKTSTAKLYPADHVKELRTLFKKGDYVGAYAYAKEANSAVAQVIRAGVSLSPEGKTMTEEAIISEITRIQAELKGRASYLSVIGVCTPMMGLTGTVTGMMKAFQKLATTGAGDPSSLSGAIGEVLVATASGLFIAIPAFIAYYLLTNRINKGVHDIGEIVSGLFRSFPYDEIAGRRVGDDEIYASKPDWNASPAPAEKA